MFTVYFDGCINKEMCHTTHRNQVYFTFGQYRRNKLIMQQEFLWNFYQN